MKKLTLILLSIVMIVALAACGDKKCDHAYDNACDVTCNECGEERTITHDWNDATCLTPKTCKVCGATEGEALGHTPNDDDGNCLTEITCSVCGTVTTPARDSHTGGTATCTEKAVCTACGTAYGTIDVNNHIDENTDHICDHECGMTDIGTHDDSAEDNDHVCDYGCGVILEDHKGGDGTATCEHGKVCSVCGEYYGDTLEHNYTYTANDDTNTITAACVNSCGHSQTIELNAPENAIYNGNKIEATVTGADGITYSLTYNADPVGSGTYTATLTVGDKSVSVDFTIAKATPTYEVPTGLTATYGDTLAKVELPTGWAWNDAESTSVGNAGTSTFKATFTPADTTNYIVVESEVTITVAKAEIDGSTLINPEFAEGLIYNGTAQALVTKTGSVDGGYIVYSLSIDGEYTTTIPVATEAGTYRVYWTIECDENHYVDGTPGSSRVTIAAKHVTDATVTLGEYDSVYNGTAKEPGVTSVVTDGKTLIEGTDYTVSYKNNVYVGTATVTITFKGNYTGTATATFEIIQDPNTDEFDGEWVIF